MKSSIIAAALTTAFFSASVLAEGGVGLGTTRVIYQSKNKSVALNVRNTHQEKSFLIQSWMENPQGERTKDFFITPPLFILKKQSENSLKIIYNGKPLPEDKESLFWITVKAIPDQSSQKVEQGLHLASASKIKLFYRPEHLSPSSTNAFKHIEVTKEKNRVVFKNPTPYYLTLVNVGFDNSGKHSFMLSPGGKEEITASANFKGNVSYQTINDYGAWTEKITINITNKDGARGSNRKI